ncbi:MAG: thiamine phosphate synthase, partial [Armatimonadetes bacterium]|nr:thiamine phosphate synthase [Armatimonadota bacterium]
MFPGFSFPQLYVITDTAPRSGSEQVRTHEEIVRAAIEAGARIVQIRDKSSDTRSLIKEVERCVGVVEAVHGILFVNDRVDVALAAGAHGVHLGDEDMSVGKARELAGDGRLIGASAATLEEAKAAIAAGADYVSVGAIFATKTKLDAGEPVGCER